MTAEEAPHLNEVRLDISCSPQKTTPYATADLQLSRTEATCLKGSCVEEFEVRAAGDMAIRLGCTEGTRARFGVSRSDEPEDSWVPDEDLEQWPLSDEQLRAVEGILQLPAKARLPTRLLWLATGSGLFVFVTSFAAFSYLLDVRIL